VTETVQLHARSAGARVVFTLQLALLVFYLIGSFGLVLSAMNRTGDYAAFFHPGVERLGDPKDALTPIGPDSTSNPLFWVFGLSQVLGIFVRPLALVLTVLGATFLATSRRAADRRTVHRVAAATAAWLGIGVLSFIPYGASLLTWLLD
jgi:hypothetical protein